MGWWSTTIMGGDEPMDSLYDLNNLVMTVVGAPQAHPDFDSGEDYLYRTNPGKFRDLLQKVPAQDLQDFINDDKCSEGKYIRAHVVAYLHMLVGATLPQSLKDAAIDACRKEDLSVWKNRDARAANLADFEEMVTSYDDATPQSPEMQNFFDVHMERNMSI